MTDPESRAHWDNAYATKAESEVSWFQTEPLTSLEFIRRCGTGTDVPIIDIGGGEARLVDRLLDAGYADVTVLDISAEALSQTRQRLGDRSHSAKWIAASITEWIPARQYAIWHDRAVMHFLTEAKDRAAYVRALLAAVTPGGCVVISTFALDGPERCSGLPVVRYSSETLAGELGPQFSLAETANVDHVTPWGSVQRFQCSRFKRI